MLIKKSNGEDLTCLNLPRSNVWKRWRKRRIIRRKREVYYYYSIQYNSKWNYNTLIPPRRAQWPGIQGG